MPTWLIILLTNAVTFFLTWRAMAFYAHHLPSVLSQTGGMKVWEFLTDDDVEWIQSQMKSNPNFMENLRRLRRTSSATTAGQDQ